ncbi:HNH endonuclease signature motif containing protein [Salinibacterium sp. ZJ70]|uniref:HNH endonuclease signature motif containing protein n=1 Tax=Salinibacterium sp. ZJ70 TaxID=2708084 RepID=UPI00141F86AD|nr:HNH endonuclease signature motif containing protein [Salinibacterium sp. ZJ70]
MSLSREVTDKAGALIESLAGAHFADLTDLGTADFLESLRILGELSRVVDALGAVLSGELTRRVRTDADFRRDALGGDVGGRFATELLRDLLRIDDAAIRDWDCVGDAITPRTTLHGELLPCVHEPIAEAIRSATITARSAAIIIRGIDGIASYADAEMRDSLETTLIERAPSLTTRELAQVVRTLPDRFNPDGAEPREDMLRERSRVALRELPNGLTRLTADLHPEAAGFVRTALDAHTAPRRQVAFHHEHAGPDSTPTSDAEAGITFATNDDIDLRPLAQKRVDALVALCRDSLSRDHGTLAGTSVTMLVTVSLDALRSGVGTATISGVDEPISAGTARRLSADAELIPAVLGTDSEILDLGRSARLYSAAQRRALALRDGGCIWPGCHIPPGWCEVAHVTAWMFGGGTDLDNGALMCAHHHRRFDHDGWTLRRDRGTPYLVPPPWLDPRQTPRPAGRIPLAA